MYNRFVLIVVFVPLAIILIALAVANRELVAFTLDPFNPGNPALTLKLPLFVFLFLATRRRPCRRQRRRPGSSRAAIASWRASARRKCRACATRAIRGTPPMRSRCPGRRLDRLCAFAVRRDQRDMLTVCADGVDAALTLPGLVETLREAFRAGAVQPVRHHHTIERPDGAASTLLLMPAWTDFHAAGGSGRRPYRRQGRDRVARQQCARQAGRDGPLSAA